MKKIKLRRRLFCFFLSFLLILQAMPSGIFANEQNEDIKDLQTDSTEVTVQDESFDVYVKWMFENENIKNSDKGILNIKADIEKENSKDIKACSIEFALTADEAKAMNILSEDGLTINDDAFKNVDNNNENADTQTDNNITAVLQEDNSVHIVLGLDSDNSSFEYEYKFNVSDKTSLPFVIDVSEDDIIVNAMGSDKETVGDVNVNKEINKITISKDEEALSGNEGEKSLDKEEADSNSNAKVSNSQSRTVEDSVTIDSYLTNYSREIFWVDNNNESSIRPSISSYLQPSLQFSLDGKTYKTLSEDNMDEIGLQSYPKFSVDNTGVGVYTIYAGNRVLPSKVTYEDTYGNKTSYNVSWKIEPKKADGYTLVEVTDENKDEYPSVDDTG